ncbi:pyruvate kinase [Nisaea sp.]|uniref:pyruvate kinase n=1 Tax=Nisaea sp. TaxID=2024842 RepID=UPI0032EE12DF
MNLLCTLGPASFEGSVIRKLDALGVDLFRINLSHTAVDEISDRVKFVQEHSAVPISLDTEGAQIRTGKMRTGTIELAEHMKVHLVAEPMLGDSGQFSLYPAYALSLLEVGDLIMIDFNAVMIQIVELNEHDARARVITGGTVGSNKAVSVNRPLRLQPLTDKDRQAVTIGRGLGIRHFALSFANSASDVDLLRQLASEDAHIIAKIESRSGLAHCTDIARAADAILIDRGDLSREVPIERLPITQKRIIQTAKKVGTPVYVATNLLESMVVSPVPTRAEINDIYNTLLDGADGLVLAAETAIGDHPVACAAMIRRLIQQFRSDTGMLATTPTIEIAANQPHGGILVSGTADADTIALAEQDSLPSLHADDMALSDIEQICHGTYSPIDRFLGKEELRSVLSDNRLLDGTVWPLPIVLPVSADQARALSVGQRVAIRNAQNQLHSILDISEIYEANLDALASDWFGTQDRNHPGIRSLEGRGSHFVAGKLALVAATRGSDSPYRLPPATVRDILAQKGWTRVVGFHSRNVAHQVHTHLQLEALERANADGLLISPVLGFKKPGDFLSAPILESYEALLQTGIYSRGKVVLGGFATYSRYAGPREAVFTALCRKNMGCTHFVVGRDHTGVGDFYAADAAQAFFKSLPDLGITPIFFDAYAYDLASGQYVPTREAQDPQAISGTEARAALLAGRRLPDWYMHPVVQDVLFTRLKAGQDVFHGSNG